MNSHGPLRYAPWTNLDTVPAGEYVLDSLLQVLKGMDGAVFLTYGVDQSWWRSQAVATPRDNVVLEAGMAFAMFGRQGTAIVSDERAHLPSDLHGLTTIRYERSGHLPDDISDLHAHLSAFFAPISASSSPLRRLWSEAEYSIVVHSFRNPEKGEFEEIVNIHAVSSLGHLTDCLSRLGQRWALVSSRGDAVPVTSNLVLVGSGASNRITKRLVDQVRGDLRFTAEFDAATMGSRRVRDRDSGLVYEPHFVNRELSLDYGILTKIPNPNEPSSWVIMMEGNYGCGTCGAAMLAVDGVALEAVKLPLEAAFQVVVAVPVFGRFVVGRPKVVESHVLVDRHP